jgi:hypothetical protein
MIGGASIYIMWFEGSGWSVRAGMSPTHRKYEGQAETHPVRAPVDVRRLKVPRLGVPDDCHVAGVDGEVAA